MDRKTDYDDIINMPHHVSNKHAHMSMHDRAAQFAPFTALTGHNDAIRETARITEREKIIDDDMKSVLDERIAYIRYNISSKPSVSIDYFVSDEKKEGGRYFNIKGNVEKLDFYKKIIRLTDGKEISVDNIINIDILWTITCN